MYNNEVWDRFQKNKDLNKSDYNKRYIQIYKEHG